MAKTTARWAWLLGLSGALLVACSEDADPGGTTASSGAGGATSGATTSDATSTSTTGTGGQGGEGGTPSPCGDGVLDDGEGCDDGDLDGGDGCDGLCVVEVGYGCAGEPSDCTPLCGDGLVLGGEGCDDGGLGDPGCDARCAVVPGYACDGEPSTCVAICGDGLVVGDEGCDDGAAIAGDGCDDLCLIEVGWECDGAPSLCAAVCSDGLIAGNEGCDDTNLFPGDGCDDLCAIEPGWGCDGAPSTCQTTCSDGVPAGSEACDDMNATPGDGCDGACAIEAGWACQGAPSVCTTDCGDGIVAGSEACDDLANMDGDGCDAACAEEPGYSCAGNPSVCVTSCGDGIPAGSEACDDGAQQSGDGCTSGCAVEPGFDCTGSPSLCDTTCGDGILAGLETCDDFDALPGDGCDGSCHEEAGYDCVGQPSACAPVCGDGILVAGLELCDDGNQVDDDGCSASCIPGTGESCSGPLGPGQAVINNGQYVWSIPSGAVSQIDTSWACDASGSGPDAVIYYLKTTDTLANGGKLLHVKADVPGSTSTANFLNLRVLGGSCSAGNEEKCLWYKHDWDAFLDVPAGPYFLWVAKNSTGTYPAVTVLAEEVPAAAAEGEGCFAPYTTASANYTAPAGAGQPHTWSIPASINSFDMGKTWGAPGSISCDDTAPYGDIHGVDAVIAFDKTVSTSVLSVSVQNLDPVLTQSDLDYEVLTTCDPTTPSKLSLSCGANADTFAGWAGGFSATHYVWVAAEATGEELNGASVAITELFPGPGESRYTAIPLAGSGPVAPGSTMRIEPPSCIASPTNVTWYVFTPAQDIVAVQTNGAGAVGFVDASGVELACVASAQATPAAALATAGQPLYIAVPSGGAISSLTLTTSAYTGLSGVATDLLVQFPSSATTDYWLASDATSLYFGGSTKVFAFPKAGNAMATEYTSGFGITSTHLGYSAVFATAGLLSLDTTTSTSASRLFRIYDAVTTTWGPTSWDVAPTYPASSGGQAVATDGTSVFMATYNTASKVDFYAYSASAAGAPTALGTNTSVRSVVGLAVDATYFYVAGISTSTSVEGVYRIPRASVATAATLLAAIDTTTLHNQVEVDDYVAPGNLYVRENGGDLRVVANPASATPLDLGIINTLGTTSDYAMTYDHALDVIYLYETETNSAGNIVLIQ